MSCGEEVLESLREREKSPLFDWTPSVSRCTMCIQSRRARQQCGSSLTQPVPELVKATTESLFVELVCKDNSNAKALRQLVLSSPLLRESILSAPEIKWHEAINAIPSTSLPILRADSMRR
jgi:hypothetical protein